ncbi:hypothetical protein EDB81DRAFT_806515 [Dactylonectria macrodidyma]|uniref:5'-deoxynucleotidase n=1 Tax=Dactylonectria macrodidyma TaxID=307937 RepID=A0A9P9E8W9_9HYPO|nr:hypothetical protein EDB81DRAFT_806515 [Dactylonectria macrodidyma]
MPLYLGNEPRELVNVCKEINTLRRAGWLSRGVPREDCESVGDHTAKVVEIVQQISGQRPKIDGTKACKMAQCHDYAEVFTGDLTPADKVSPEDKQCREDNAYRRFQELHSERGKEIETLCVEYRAGSTLEARLVKDIDKLQRLERAFDYRKRYTGLNFRDFRADRDLVSDAELRRRADNTIAEWDKLEARLREQPLYIFIIGPPGVGKGTQCSRAVMQPEGRALVHISVGDLLRRAAADKNSKFHVEANKVLQGITPAPADLVLDLIQNASSENGTRAVLLDGFPYDEQQFSVFCEKTSKEFHTIEFYAPRPILETRLGRRSSSSGRKDDEGDRWRIRLDNYEVRGSSIARKLFEANPNTYFQINAKGSVDELAAEFQSLLEKLIPKQANDIVPA